MARVLVFSTLYPNAARPNHGVFVENRLRETVALGGIEATVVAPVPFFPSSDPMFGRYADFARAPAHEVRHGLDIWRPRYLVIPKIGMEWTPGFLYRAGLAAVRRLQKAGQAFDVIDAHYFYPDGVAAARLGRTLRLPVVITGRGTDLTVVPEHPGPRAAIRQAALEAAANVAVCDDLGRRLVALGAPAERTLVMRNGVDLTLFAEQDRAEARARLGVEGFVLLSVGSLIPRKGHHLAIQALVRCRDCTLLIAGGGPLRAELETLARRLGVSGRVRFLGEIRHEDLPPIYAAADAAILASSREGWANVLLEAMACGTPVVATNVNGTGEVISTPAAGRLMTGRSPSSLVESLDQLRRDLPDRSETRRHAERFGWRQIAEANKALLQALASAGYENRHAPDIVGGAREILL